MSRMVADCENVSMDEEHVKIIIYNLLCSLNFIHSAQIMHRDLKSANVLINSDCNVKICDFGLARTIPVRNPKTV